MGQWIALAILVAVFGGLGLIIYQQHQQEVKMSQQNERDFNAKRVPATPEQRAEALGAIRAADAHAKALGEKRRLAFQDIDAIERLAPDEPAVRCPIQPPPPTEAGDPQFNEGSKTFRLTSEVRREAIRTALGAIETRVKGEADLVEFRLSNKSTEFDVPAVLKSARELPASVVPIPYDLTLVVDEKVEPHALGNDTFSPGFLRGTLYLWSYEQQAIVCAATVESHSSESVRVLRPSGTGGTSEPQGRNSALDLGVDLYRQALRDGLGKLTEVHPPTQGRDAGAGD